MKTVRRIASMAGVGLALACGDPSHVQSPEAPWQLSWSDEFDGPSGQLPDESKWVFDVGGDGWGNNQLEYDSDSLENVALDGEGNLRITARRQSIGNNRYTGGRIKTLGRFSQAYGRVEARLKVPAGRGVWPAFWMLGDSFPTVGWPACGEIDIMELRGQEPSVAIGSLHGPGYSGGGAITARHRLAEGRFDEAFHRFAVEWDPTRIAFLVDDEVYNVVRAADVVSKGEWAFDAPFFLILNVAVGGGFVGDPDASTVFPQSMIVDWVRVSRRTP